MPKARPCSIIKITYPKDISSLGGYNPNMGYTGGMEIYKTKSSKIGATRYRDVYHQAWDIYKTIKKQTKRRPYIRSAYFNKDKVFFDYYWRHLDNSSYLNRRKRLRYFSCGIELIRRSRVAPTTKLNPNKPSEIPHRFAGTTRDGEPFYVQIKEDTRKNQKYLMSIFAPA